MNTTVTPRDAVNWQTLLQIARLLPSGNKTPLVSFTNPDDAAQFMRQQDPPGTKLCLLTKDASLFWIVPISTAEQLLQNGFQQILKTIRL
ncbi:hypothetical protein [Spirosoma rhododendri]|uniref:Uncharacterized protein n=1 Tax=Spirosoma rhododendri TaxID=2728024 RepID=A0A7L5DQB4_9BACT|nr:hypothetical protein [Spirosoma rhododendri]QJD77900.1 hypothetical protein HH216_05265 [Spirosoma rhododendri]